MIYDFSQIDEIKLAVGSHTSPNDGLCFMEMVAFFAGEKHSDKPDCACPVLGAYGIALNDRMPADVRDQLLKPLVPLVAGTRDKASEQKRVEFLTLWETNKVLPIVLRDRGFNDHARACEQATSLNEARAAANAANAADAAANAANTAANAAANTAVNAAAAEIWQVAVEGLRQAILIGRHDGLTAAVPVIVQRREALRELACVEATT